MKLAAIAFHAINERGLTSLSLNALLSCVGIQKEDEWTTWMKRWQVLVPTVRTSHEMDERESLLLGRTRKFSNKLTVGIIHASCFVKRAPLSVTSF